jgi:proteasome lid subunit RPN8/RPN11
MTPTDHDLAAGAFRPHGRSKVTLLVQPRPRRNPAYVLYGDQLASPEVFVHRRVIEDLRREALEAMPHETIGALLGRPCRDDYGIYVVVENAMTAAPDEHEGTPGAVRISGDGRASMHRRAAQRHPTLEPVGWWHSHPRGAPRYSSVDRDEQHTYPRPHHVGIVVAAEYFDDRPPSGGRGADPLGVYVGPSSALLARRAPRAAEEEDEQAMRIAATPPRRVVQPQPPPVALGAYSSSPAAPAGGGEDDAPRRPPMAMGAPPRSSVPPATTTAGISNALLFGVGGVIALGFVVMVIWVLVAAPESGPGSESGLPNVSSNAPHVTCRPGGGRQVRLASPARADEPKSADSGIATGRVRGSRLTVVCKHVGQTVLTVGDALNGDQVVVDVLPDVGAVEPPG